MTTKESDVMRISREAGERLARESATWSQAKRDHFERLTGSKLPAPPPPSRPSPAAASDPAAVESVLAKVIEVKDAGRAGVIARIDGVYAERTLLILALTRLFPSGLKAAPVEGMPAEFETAVYIDTPAGQMSWHVHVDDLPAFAHLPEYGGDWDGHTTAEKYRRLTAPAFGDTEERKALLFYANAFEYAGQDDNVAPEPTDALHEDAGLAAMEALAHRHRWAPNAREAALADLEHGAVETQAGPPQP